jgi:hypothetical protein
MGSVPAWSRCGSILTSFGLFALCGCMQNQVAPQRPDVDFVYHNPAKADFSTRSLRDMNAMAARIAQRCMAAGSGSPCMGSGQH